jgi:hypothetical protein
MSNDTEDAAPDAGAATEIGTVVGRPRSGTTRCCTTSASKGCHYMFARFRQTPNRLNVSIVETRRLDGRVRHEHIASLGSIAIPLSVVGRIAFWRRVNERLGKLSNRIDPAMQGKVRGDIHARIPMVTLDEQRALQLANAEADERFWSVMHDMNQEKVDGTKALIATAQGAIATGEAEASKAAVSLARAKDRAERIRRGEDVQGGLGGPVDFETMLRKAGMSDEVIQHCKDMAELRLSHEELEKLVDEQLEAAIVRGGR